MVQELQKPLFVGQNNDMKMAAQLQKLSGFFAKMIQKILHTQWKYSQEILL